MPQKTCRCYLEAVVDGGWRKYSCYADGCYEFEVSDCCNCHGRHVREATALKGELVSLRTSHETELSNVTANCSLALTEKNAECEQLLSEVTTLTAENDSLRNVKDFLKLQRGALQCKWHLRTETGSEVSAGDVAQLFVLASRSQVVLNMLSSPMSRVISFMGQIASSSAVFEEVLNFCYCGEIAFSEVVRPGEVLGVAHALNIGLLKDFCEAELCRQLSVDNVLDMVKLSRKFAVSKLQEDAEKLVKEHFDMLFAKVYEVLEGVDRDSEELDDDSE